MNRNSDNNRKDQSKIQNPQSKIEIGCQGWNYPDWVSKAGGESIFYPRGTRSNEMLEIYAPDFVIANAENLSLTNAGRGPCGMTQASLERLFALGVQLVTGGNHSRMGSRSKRFTTILGFCAR